MLSTLYRAGGCDPRVEVWRRPAPDSALWRMKIPKRERNSFSVRAIHGGRYTFRRQPVDGELGIGTPAMCPGRWRERMDRRIAVSFPYCCHRVVCADPPHRREHKYIHMHMCSIQRSERASARTRRTLSGIQLMLTATDTHEFVIVPDRIGGRSAGRP